MIRIIKEEEKRVNISEFEDPNLTEVIFENFDNWFIVYSVQKLDFVYDYCQSTKGTEIVDTCVVNVEKGEEPLFVDNDGKGNLELIRLFKSETPELYKRTRFYEEIVRKELDTI